MNMFWAFAVIFGICEFGQRLCGAFDEVNHLYDQTAWYLFPYNVQHALSYLMMVAQKPVELRVFGSISCGRVTLENVSKIILFEKINKLQNQIDPNIFVLIFSPLFRYSKMRIHVLWYFGALKINFLVFNQNVCSQFKRRCSDAVTYWHIFVLCDISGLE